MMFTRFIRLLGAGVVAALVVLGPVSAQEIPPEQLALARKYVDLTNKAGIYELALLKSAVKTGNLFIQSNPELAEQINAAITAVLDTYRGKSDDLLNQIARAYAVPFTMEELTQIVAFYETPAGQKLATLARDNNEAVEAILGVFSSNLGTEFLAKVRVALKAEGFNL